MHKLALGLAPMLMAIGTAAAAQTPQWQVSETSGDVRIVENGRSRAAVRGALLASGSTLATAARARAVIVRGQEYVVVSPSTQLRIPDQTARGGIIQVLADWGTALFRIERRATPHFGVQTPYLAAVVKGTTFTVDVRRSGASVQVTEGAVEVSTVDGGAAEMVRPGMIASVSASDLYQLNIEGENSRSIRSDGAPSAGVVTVPAAAQGAYAGPVETPSVVITAVREEPIPLAEATGGLLSGPGAAELALADVVDVTRSGGAAIASPTPTPTPATPAPAPASPPPAAPVDPAPVTPPPAPTPPPVEPPPAAPVATEPPPVTPPPVEPPPVAPPPVEPPPVEPPPVEPAPVEPPPVEPPPVEPPPVEPAPVEPPPVDPPPVEPPPVDPPPVEPPPVEPPPVEPPPVEPPPVEPPPVEPPPVEPVIDPPPVEEPPIDSGDGSGSGSGSDGDICLLTICLPL